MSYYGKSVMPEKIWIDGKLVPFAEATVHFLEPVLHYGLSVFEGMRSYETPKGPAVFRIREHLERLLDGARILGIRDLPYDLEQLRGAVHDTMRVNGLTECYVRPLLYMTGWPLRVEIDDFRPVIGIAAWERRGSHMGKDAAQKGARMMVSSFTRHHPNVSMTKTKTAGNYVNSSMAKTLAVRAGFDGAIMLDPEGFVSECATENLLLVRDGRIYTPPTATILEGVTRDSLLTLAGDLGIEAVQERISRDQLYMADEIMACGTATECIGVTEVDHRVIGDGGIGPVTLQLQKSYAATVRGGGERSGAWLDYVDMGAARGS